MYICHVYNVSVCIHEHTHTVIHAYLCNFMHTYTYYTYIYTFAHNYLYMYGGTLTSSRGHNIANICTHTRSHTHIYIYICTGRYVRRRLKGHQVHESAWNQCPVQTQAFKIFSLTRCADSIACLVWNSQVPSYLTPPHPPQRQDVSHVASLKNENAQNIKPTQFWTKMRLRPFRPTKHG